VADLNKTDEIKARSPFSGKTDEAEHRALLFYLLDMNK
jgi:hypothetical protein